METTEFKVRDTADLAAAIADKDGVDYSVSLTKTGYTLTVDMDAYCKATNSICGIGYIASRARMAHIKQLTGKIDNRGTNKTMEAKILKILRGGA